jgi:hypothetical protein
VRQPIDVPGGFDVRQREALLGVHRCLGAGRLHESNGCTRHRTFAARLAVSAPRLMAGP